MFGGSPRADDEALAGIGARQGRQPKQHDDAVNQDILREQLAKPTLSVLVLVPPLFLFPLGRRKRWGEEILLPPLFLLAHACACRAGKT